MAGALIPRFVVAAADARDGSNINSIRRRCGRGGPSEYSVSSVSKRKWFVDLLSSVQGPFGTQTWDDSDPSACMGCGGFSW